MSADQLTYYLSVVISGLTFLFPIIVPVGMSFVLMAVSGGARIEKIPVQLCYSAFTFDIWALTTLLTGQQVQYFSRDIPQRWVLVVCVFIFHLYTLPTCTRLEEEGINPGFSFEAWFWGISSILLALVIRL